jgi:hypothetical protein
MLNTAVLLFYLLNDESEIKDQLFETIVKGKFLFISTRNYNLTIIFINNGQFSYILFAIIHVLQRVRALIR